MSFTEEQYQELNHLNRYLVKSAKAAEDRGDSFYEWSHLAKTTRQYYRFLELRGHDFTQQVMTAIYNCVWRGWR